MVTLNTMLLPLEGFYSTIMHLNKVYILMDCDFYRKISCLECIFLKIALHALFCYVTDTFFPMFYKAKNSFDGFCPN